MVDECCVNPCNLLLSHDDEMHQFCFPSEAIELIIMKTRLSTSESSIESGYANITKLDDMNIVHVLKSCSVSSFGRYFIVWNLKYIEDEFAICYFMHTDWSMSTAMLIFGQVHQADPIWLSNCYVIRKGIVILSNLTMTRGFSSLLWWKKKLILCGMPSLNINGLVWGCW